MDNKYISTGISQGITLHFIVLDTVKGTKTERRKYRLTEVSA